MYPSVLHIDILSPTLVEVSAPPGELGTITNFFSDRGFLAMRQADCVAIEGCWRTVMRAFASYDGDAWLSESVDDEALVSTPD